MPENMQPSKSTKIISDNLFTTEEARSRLIKGINKASSAVGGTMGTGGANAIIEAMEAPGHLTTNDGATILQSLKFADPIEEMGRKILLEAVSRANKQSGDGSSTTTILTAAIINEGIKQVGDYSPMDIKRSLENELVNIEKSLAKQTRQITMEDVGKVATISAEDEQIGNLIQEIYSKIGKEGIIHWDISKTSEDSYTIGKGITIHDAGYISPYMCDIDEKTGQSLNIARWKNPYILVVRQKISGAGEFNSLFKSMNDREIKEVVIFCDEIEAPVIQDLIMTRAMRGFKALVIKVPVIWKDEWFEDIAKTSGATIIDPSTGVSLKTVAMEHLGRYEHITVSKDETFIDGIKDISKHIDELVNESTEQSANRVARLNTSTARLFIGAHSDSALSYRRLKVEDAINAGWQALNGGVVVGGGVALLNAREALSDTVGGFILREALLAPVNQIISNTGEVRSDKIGGEMGFNSKTKKVVNMFDEGIIDPANVVVNTCRNAISVAAAILTTNTVITLPSTDQSL